MDDLFLKERPDTTIEKEAEAYSFYLNQDNTQWVTEIITSFLETFPYLQEEPISVSWSKKDNEKGYAVGNLNVIGISVPVIIKDFKLAPLDIMILPEGTLPLNDFFLRRIYDKPEAFEGLELKRKSPYENLFGGSNSLQISPTNEYSSGNQRTSRPAVKVASVIEKLSFVHKDDVNEILEAMSDPVVKRGFEKNGTFDVARKLVDQAKQSTKTASLDDFVRDLEIDRQLVYEDSFGNKFVKQANSKFNKTWTTKIDSLEAYEMEEMITNTEKVANFEKKASKTQAERLIPEMLKIGETGQMGWVDDTKEEEPFQKLANFYISDIKEVEERPKLANFNIQDSNKRLSMTKEGSWDVNEKELTSNMDFDDIEGGIPKIGSFGAFVTEKTASQPFEITGMTKNTKPGAWEIKGEAGFNKVAYFPINVASEEFEEHEKEKNAYYVPKNAKWVDLKEKNEKLAELKDFEAKIKVEGLNGFNKIAFYGTDDESYRGSPKKVEDGYVIHETDALFVKEAEEEESFTKEASEMVKGHEVYRDKAGFYSLRGSEFAKYAEEAPIRNLDEDSAKWSLIHCGATSDDIEKLAELQPNRSFKVEGQIKSPMSLSNLDKALDGDLEKTAGKKLTISKLLVKEASQFSDKTSVDAVLSLNLMRKKNIEDYLVALPTLEHVLSTLSKLLIGARLGMENVDPQAVKEAVDALSQVVVQLYEVKSTIKKVK